MREREREGDRVWEQGRRRGEETTQNDSERRENENQSDYYLTPSEECRGHEE